MPRSIASSKQMRFAAELLVVRRAFWCTNHGNAPRVTANAASARCSPLDDLLISFDSDVGTSRGTGGVNPTRAGLLRSPIADSLTAATTFSQTLVLGTAPTRAPAMLVHSKEPRVSHERELDGQLGLATDRRERDAALQAAARRRCADITCARLQEYLDRST